MTRIFVWSAYFLCTPLFCTSVAIEDMLSMVSNVAYARVQTDLTMRTRMRFYVSFQRATHMQRNMTSRACIIIWGILVEAILLSLIRGVRARDYR